MKIGKDQENGEVAPAPWEGISAVIWDWNGTLLDDAWLCVEELNRLAAEQGVAPVTLEDYWARFRFPVVDYYCELGFAVEDGAFERTSESFIAGYNARRKQCAVFPEVRETLQAVRARGLGQSLLSAYRADYLEEVVAEQGLTELFDYRMGIGDILAGGKVAQGRKLLAQMALPPGEVLLIGDTEHDWEVASALGVRCVLLEHGHSTPARLRRTGARVLRGVGELRERAGW